LIAGIACGIGKLLTRGEHESTPSTPSAAA